eukprot:scaffold31763_cov36-Tisochrysis_lutea.AAC.2
MRLSQWRGGSRGPRPSLHDLDFSLFPNLGAADCPVIDTLACLSEEELRKYRWRRRGWSKPRSPYTLVQLAERAGAAGLRSPLGLYDILAEMLAESDEYPEISLALQRGRLWLGHERAACWLYRAARKQTKLTVHSATMNAGLPTRQPTPASYFDLSNLASRVESDDVGSWTSLFDDPRAPLVIDLGCGYGVGSLTAAAGLAGRDGIVSTLSSRVNYLGCDLSAQGVSYARSIARRWGIDARAVFVRDDALTVLHAVEKEYNGPIIGIVLCCPSPYKAMPPSVVQGYAEGWSTEALASDASSSIRSGNSQLPDSAVSETFLGNPEVLATAARLLCPGGLLLLSSNAEDVAVTLATSARALGLENAVVDYDTDGVERNVSGKNIVVADAELMQILDLTTPISMQEEGYAQSRREKLTNHPSAGALSRRSIRWRAQGGDRGEGPGWRQNAGWVVSKDHLPRWDQAALALFRPAWSETELAHRVDGAAVHRLLLRKPAR